MFYKCIIYRYTETNHIIILLHCLQTHNVLYFKYSRLFFQIKYLVLFCLYLLA